MVRSVSCLDLSSSRKAEGLWGDNLIKGLFNRVPAAEEKTRALETW